MKRILTLLLLCLLFAGVKAQTSEPVLVLASGEGETKYAPINGFEYSHHTNYSMQLKSITVKWDLRLLLGEPVVNGVFKWTAGKDTPVDYLDYRDYVLLECVPKKSAGYLVYIKIAPTVPKSGEGYGYNTPGSPSWKSVFCTRDGKDMTTKIPDFTAEKAKEIWKSGFYITGVVLARQGGKDGYLNSPDDLQAKDTKKPEEFTRKNREKYEALLNPFNLSVKDNDTVYNNVIRPVKYLNPYFSSALVYLRIENNEFVSESRSIQTDMYLSPGWNKFIYSIIGKGIGVTDSLEIFYSKGGRYLMEDDFNDGILDGKWVVNNGSGNFYQLKEENGALFLHGNGIINGPLLKVNPHRKLIIEVRSLSRGQTCYEANNVYVNINNRWGFLCRENCGVLENAKVVCDLVNGTVECFVNGEMIENYENRKIDFRAEEGIQVGLSCRYSERWEIDEIKVYQ